jgi:hypothetical protein
VDLMLSVRLLETCGVHYYRRESEFADLAVIASRCFGCRDGIPVYPVVHCSVCPPEGSRPIKRTLVFDATDGNS